MNWLVFWLAAVILLSIIEIFTFQLVAIWPAIGGIGGLLACTLGASVTVQFVVFIVISILLLILTRPMVKRILNNKQVRTNADRFIDRTAVVTEDISNPDSTGAAIISGITWIARSTYGHPIPKGAKVRIDRIEGSKLIVSKIDQTNI